MQNFLSGLLPDLILFTPHVIPPNPPSWGVGGLDPSRSLQSGLILFPYFHHLCLFFLWWSFSLHLHLLSSAHLFVVLYETFLRNWQDSRCPHGIPTCFSTTTLMLTLALSIIHPGCTMFIQEDQFAIQTLQPFHSFTLFLEPTMSASWLGNDEERQL